MTQPTTTELPSWLLAGVVPETQPQPAPVVETEAFDPLAGLDLPEA